MNFKDNFSKQASIYAKYRPSYPEGLYDFLLQQVPNKTQAWDCATGNGQVAKALASHFDQVMATDASKAQIDHAVQMPNIHYHVATAEDSGLANDSVDFIAVGQAAHWFRMERFYEEVQRVARPGAMLALWGYGLGYFEAQIANASALNTLIRHFYTQVVGKYWDAERKHIDNAYESIVFPYEPIATPDFKMKLNWSLDDLLGYLKTWSSVQKYIVQNGVNPVETLRPELTKVWGEEVRQRTITWDIYLKFGKVQL
ncbi:class I SAM-dependent methyltransferase [Microscilla marina]|uniref:SAM (And some other nucleotide) binding motif n=1 Tax=Microscilla marina ATCC 23134 TaxID=313606 RepID=A1ZND6_MICM2|nr:class I SAM-dependent methyltransferase [Microscilla marina]EAY28047.1 SAM (and some other nucleotide) binding motif [Microscilla marina ATCC 23134]